MGWVWIDDTGDLDSSAVDGAKFDNSTYPSSSDRCSTRNVVRSHCKTEEVEPGKFVRKCERTEEILRDCIGRTVFSTDACLVSKAIEKMMRDLQWEWVDAEGEVFNFVRWDVVSKPLALGGLVLGI
ncbi:uncharacterized protein E5676_scaffold352G004830 [Cucumis melo var. makuwa]|uniref:Uncharacterized protein n=1 Tax=Cucumis melo var. makuwa TaxID=1194695 RepID=A0A5D3DP19_CUCMM|nr:uncharacterized protein E5676_scaffold352G004830 [Cucumis melo var. makuwa]